VEISVGAFSCQRSAFRKYSRQYLANNFLAQLDRDAVMIEPIAGVHYLPVWRPSLINHGIFDDDEMDQAA